MTPTLPVLFVPHGAPTFALRPGAAGAALAAMAQSLPRPRAIVILSAHWQTETPTVGYADRPATIHDFWGFPEALYTLRYPASGCREAADAVVTALEAAGLPVQRDEQRGLDHGAWIPLRMMFPDADLPVIPLSIPRRGGAQAAYQLGQALTPLTAQGFLIIASGNLTHNLGDFQQAGRGQTPAYVRAFPEWIAERLTAGDLASVLDYRRQAPDAVQAHPTEEHLLPLHVALGAAGASAGIQRFHAGIDDYVLAMDAYAFSPRAGDRA